MDPLRVLKGIVVAALALSLLVLPAASYDNAKAHPAINYYALEKFTTGTMQSDPYLKNATLQGAACNGYAWEPMDGALAVGVRHSVQAPRTKSLWEWIPDAGYAADEPEWTMALVHFYDPTNAEEPWLTDYSWVNNEYMEMAAQSRDPLFTLPRLSALQWTFDENSGGEKGAYYTQDYSWNDGLRYYQKALESDSGNNYYYGQAWRSVGETMHMISDMTVPAHVRNDGHVPLLDPDPYESSVSASDIEAYAVGVMKPIAHEAPLDYDHGELKSLMHTIALYTNQHFLTHDTAPYGTQSPGSPEPTIVTRYPRPSVQGLSPDKYGYVTQPAAGTSLKLAKKVAFFPPGNTRIDVYVVDPVVLADQRKLLIPTAIRASEEVLDRFLPRFDAHVSVDKYLPDDAYDDQYIVHATLKQVPTDAWNFIGSEGLTVRNGAYLVETGPGGQTSRGSLSLTGTWGFKNNNFNDWKDLSKFSPGTRVYMEYDLGGYVIRSNEVIIPVPTPPVTKPWTTTATTTTSIPATTAGTPAWGCVNTAACTPDHPEQCCPGTSFAPCKGCEKCCYWSDAANPVTGQKPQGFVIDAFCSCTTGESMLR